MNGTPALSGHPTSDTRRRCPTDLAELRDAVRDTRSSAPRLLVEGTGSAAQWGGRPEPADAVLETTSLTGTLVYNPADMTVAVRAGTRLSVLQAELAEHGQRVAFDPARSDATIGGLIATADGGPLRQSRGTLRDLVIGVTVVLADGTVATSGGHVIKNVAGYDLAKLFHGSLGTLGVLAEVVLRLHPVPESVLTVAVVGGPSRSAELASRLVACGLEPAALEWAGDRLLVQLEGMAGGTDERAAAIRDLAPAGAEVVLLDDAEAAACWDAVDQISLGEGGDTVLRFGALPTTAAELLETVRVSERPDGVEIEAAGSVGVGVYTLQLRGGGGDGHAAVVRRVRAAVEDAGGTTGLLRRDGLPADVPAWGAPPPAVAVMSAVKDRFDPEGRFGAGRFAGWLPARGAPRPAPRPCAGSRRTAEEA